MLQESRERCFSRATALVPASRSSCRYYQVLIATVVRGRSASRRDAAKPRRFAAQFFPPIREKELRHLARTASSRNVPLPSTHLCRTRDFLVGQPPVPVDAIAPSHVTAPLWLCRGRVRGRCVARLAKT